MISGLRKFLRQLETDAIVLGIIGLIIGVLIVLAIRFFTYKTPAVHYHANFSVYINGRHQQFKGPAYYEEESQSACNVEDKMTPEERVHMHDNVNSVVHIHDKAVTWTDFFNNIGWTVNSQLIQTHDHVFLPTQGHKIRFILNGKDVFDISDRVIEDTDRLLVDYGSGSTQSLNAEFKSVPATAHKEDISKDPASCGGSAPTTASQKLKHLF